MKKVVLHRFILFSFCCFYKLAAQNSETLQYQLDSVFINRSQSKPGGLLFIMQSNQILYQKSFGIVSAEVTKQYDDYTLFNSGSFKDVLVCYGIMLLHDQGKLKITDSLYKFYGSSNSYLKELTIWQLLMHCSGISDSLVKKKVKACKAEAGDCILKTIPRPIFSPGSLYLYSETGITLLTDIIEIVSQKKWTDFMSESILQPCGIIYSEFRQNDSLSNLFQTPEINWFTCLNDIRKLYGGIREFIFLSPETAKLTFQLNVPANWTLPQTPPNTFCWKHVPETGMFYHIAEKLTVQVFPEKEILIIHVNQLPEMNKMNEKILNSLKKSRYL